MNPFETHLPVLRELFQHNVINKVIETGCGDYSTGFFVEQDVKLTSIEMNDDAWFRKISGKYGDRANVLYLPGKMPAVEYLKRHGDCDLLFVDGNHYTRYLQVQEGFSKAKIICAHDTEALIYRWDRIKVPKDWLWIDIEQHEPWTSIAFDAKELHQNNWIKKYRHSIYDDIDDKDYTIRKIEDV